MIMTADATKDIQFEIGLVLFIDVVGTGEPSSRSSFQYTYTHGAP